jgi:hypothetical protein
MSALLRPSKDVLNFEARRKFFCRDWRALKELCEKGEAGVDSEYDQGTWDKLREAMKETVDGGKRLDVTEIFGQNFLDDVDEAYKRHIRPVMSGSLHTSMTEPVAEAFESYMDEVLMAADQIVKLADREDKNSSSYIVKSTLKAKIVFFLTPGAFAEVPTPLLTVSYWNDVNESLKLVSPAIMEVGFLNVLKTNRLV